MRHPSTTHLLRFFAYDHLPPHLQPVSSAVSDLATTMVNALPDGPELSAGLRKLLEAKDCFVRAALDARDESDSGFVPGTSNPTPYSTSWSTPG